MNDNTGPTVPQGPCPSCMEAMLVRIQQSLVALGYEYIGADVDSWPRSPVHMAKGNESILIWPWCDWSDQAAAALAEACRQAGVDGVLLIGTEPIDGPAIRLLPKSPRFFVSYIDAMTEQFRPHNGFSLTFATLPKPLTARGIKRLLHPRHADKVAAVDCRRTFLDHLARRKEAQDFFARSREIGGAEKPLLTYALIAVCVLVWAACEAWDVLGHIGWDNVLLAMGASYGPKERAGEYWRLLTCGFLHAGLLHLWLNMAALLIFGRLLEVLQGRWRFGAVYLLSIAGGSVASLWVHPMALGVGASGGIFGLAGGIAAVIIAHRRDFPPHLWRSFRKFFLTFLAYNVIFQVLPNIDTAAHIGGLVTGLLAALVIGRSPVQRRSLPMAAMLGAGLIVAALIVGAIQGVQRIAADAPAKPQASSFLLEEDRAQKQAREDAEAIGRRIDEIRQRMTTPSSVPASRPRLPGNLSPRRN